MTPRWLLIPRACARGVTLGLTLGPALVGPTLGLALGAGSAAAHESWLEPSVFRASPGAEITVDLRNGERFSGASLIYNPAQIARLDHRSGAVVSAYEGRLGDRPAMTLTPDDGLLVITHQSQPSWLRYELWEKFAEFSAHKDFGDVAARHDARGLPRADFWEVYTRFSKSLVGVGGAAGADSPTGLETEIVALENPYRLAADALPVRVLYQGAPRRDVQVELFERTGDGAVRVTTHRTDGDGVAVLPVRPGAAYLADAVVLREPTIAPFNGREAAWETLWASLTFAVPHR